MFGRTKSNEEDIFEKEERVRGELETARQQKTDAEQKISALQGEYRQAASESLGAGSDDAALALKHQIDKLEARRDGLDVKITEIEPKYQEASRVAQAERLVRNEQARRTRFDALVAEGKAAGEAVREQYEAFMRAISDFDDARERLAAPEFGNEAMHEIEVLGNSVFLAHPGGLQGALLAAGWRQRTGGKVRETYLEIVSLAAPPK